jgi:ring-1,2-phenylacetyl-CoA epoxidase subunit PaaC
MKSTTCEHAMSTTSPNPCCAHVDYVLRIADTSLILGQRLSEWCGHGPVIEEDIALTNIALDLIGQARLLLSHAGARRARPRRRRARLPARRARVPQPDSIVELPNGDFGHTMLRNCSGRGLAARCGTIWRSRDDAGLAAIAGKSAKETRYHLQHAGDWTVMRLGDGTEESHARMQRALDYGCGRTPPSSSARRRSTTKRRARPASAPRGRRCRPPGKRPCCRCSTWPR